ncbi:protease [Pedobacter panaciterrae]|uniref:Protease n=1 Tax=Pedobacter panaciterrae TaxID=363849 RepID=A0ABU8NJS4_9SPHI|nr:protease [uncultured Pedobacter sp.]
MKQIHLLLSTSLLLLASCGTNKEQSNGTASTADTINKIDTVANTQMTARMSMKPVIKAGDSLELRFTVYNPSVKPQSFCKWHTPFEPPMSKYLDIKDDKGAEARYQGAMAKRIMPPPADSYIEVKPGDSLSVKVNISKAYLLDKPGTYIVSYNAQEISGLAVKDSLTFIYKK